MVAETGENTLYDSKGEIERRTSFAFTVAVLMALSLGWFFREYFYSTAQLMLDRDYGYLAVSVITVLVTLYFSLKHVGFAYGVSLKRILIGSYLTTISLIFYASSLVDPRYMIQYQGLSFSFILLAFIGIILSPVYARDLIPLISILLLVPPPPGWIDSLTPHLSKVVGEIASYITGARLIGGVGYTTLVVSTSSGPVRFQVEYACTGIVTISSILVVIPIIFYLLAYSPRSTSRKLAASVISLIVALSLGFLGNLVRVLLVIYGTKWLGPEKGLALFHYSPSIIYATLSVLAGFYIADKLGGLRLAVPRFRLGRVLSKPEAVLGALLIIIILAGFFVIGANAVAYAGSSAGKGSGVGSGLVIEAESPVDYINNPEKYIKFINNVSMVILGKDEQLTRILNAFVVYRIIAKHGNSSYLGYLEIVDTPGRLHTWQLCLSLQGYKVDNSYTRIINGTPIYYISVHKGAQGYLLAYTLIPTRIVSPGATYKLYTRISLIAPYTGKNKENVEANLTIILSKLWSGARLATTNYVSGLISLLSASSYILLILIAAYEVYSTRRSGVAKIGTGGG